MLNSSFSAFYFYNSITIINKKMTKRENTVEITFYCRTRLVSPEKGRTFQVTPSSSSSRSAVNDLINVNIFVYTSKE